MKKRIAIVSYLLIVGMFFVATTGVASADSDSSKPKLAKLDPDVFDWLFFSDSSGPGFRAGMVFEVEADHGGPRMLAGLVQARRPGLRITPLLSQDHHLAFRVEWEPSTPAERALEDASLD